MPNRSAKATRIRVGAKRQLTLPRHALAKLRLREGDFLEIRVENDRIELIPLAMIPRDQLWYWTPEWQAGERQADADRAAGRYKDFKSMKRALAWLKL